MTESNKVAFITGASGGIGGELTKRLLEDGWDVVAPHRQGSNIKDLLKLDGHNGHSVRPVEISLYDFDQVKASMPAGTLAIFNCAGNVSYYNDGKRWDDNVKIPEVLARVALEINAKLIHVSTGATLPHQATSSQEGIKEIPGGYPQSKRAGEEKIWEYVRKGLNAVIVQPIIVIIKGDRRHYGRFFSKDDLSIALPGSLEFCNGNHVVEAILQAYYKGLSGERYVLGGEFLSWAEFLTMVSKFTGAKPPVRTARRWELYLVAIIQTLLFHLSGKRIKPEITLELVKLLKGGERVPFDEALRAERVLGYKAEGIEEACREYYEWFKTLNVPASK